MKQIRSENLRNLVRAGRCCAERADPDQWPGAGQRLASVDPLRHGVTGTQCKKNAAASFSLGLSVASPW